MHPTLHHFLTRYLALVALTLIPVIVTAFLAMPFSLNRHPAEPPAPGRPVPHMT